MWYLIIGNVIFIVIVKVVVIVIVVGVGVFIVVVVIGMVICNCVLTSNVEELLVMCHSCRITCIFECLCQKKKKLINLFCVCCSLQKKKKLIKYISNCLSMYIIILVNMLIYKITISIIIIYFITNIFVDLLISFV